MGTHRFAKPNGASLVRASCSSKGSWSLRKRGSKTSQFSSAYAAIYLANQMLITSVMYSLNCPFCSSVLVRVINSRSDDRVICPICFAVADYEKAVNAIDTLRRGTRIDAQIKFAVDRARFPAQALTENNETKS